MPKKHWKNVVSVASVILAPPPHCKSCIFLTSLAKSVTRLRGFRPRATWLHGYPGYTPTRIPAAGNMVTRIVGYTSKKKIEVECSTEHGLSSHVLARTDRSRSLRSECAPRTRRIRQLRIQTFEFICIIYIIQRDVSSYIDLFFVWCPPPIFFVRVGQ